MRSIETESNSGGYFSTEIHNLDLHILNRTGMKSKAILSAYESVFHSLPTISAILLGMPIK